MEYRAGYKVVDKDDHCLCERGWSQVSRINKMMKGKVKDKKENSAAADEAQPTE